MLLKLIKWGLIIKSKVYYRYFFKYAEERADREGEENPVPKRYSHEKSHILERAHRLVLRNVQPLLRSQETM